jgi:signal transduction histidine kinase
MAMLRKLWPASLYGQLLMAVALALLVAQAANSALLFGAAKARAVVEASSMLTARVGNHLERQRQSSDSPRQDRRRRGAPFVITTTAPLTASGFDVQQELTDLASEYLLAAVPDLQSVHLSLGPIHGLPTELKAAVLMRSRGGPRMVHQGRPHAQDAVFLTMKSADGRWLSAAAYVRPFSGQPVWFLLAQTLVFYLAVLIPLALIARWIARPLRMLTARVQKSGLVAEEQPLEPQGPSDVRELIQAFNGAQQRLGALLTEKDVMLGAIGHDLKTPLASLRVRIESVEDEAERDKMAQTVQEMTTILDDILILARLGKRSENVQVTDIVSLVEAVIADFPDGSNIAIDAASGPHAASIRPILLKRALRNLIDNALQYGGNARISLERRVDALHLIVDDDGPGLAPDQLERMFEPFTRAETSRNRAGGGTGLGLTIARAIAQAHGGLLTLENRVGGGLRARLSILL